VYLLYVNFNKAANWYVIIIPMKLKRADCNEITNTTRCSSADVPQAQGGPSAAGYRQWQNHKHDIM